VWLFERRDLPLVAAAFATRYGVAQDPPGRPGLAYLTAQMLTRGAGDRDRAQTVATLADTGASLEAYAQADGSIVTVRVSKTHFDTAFAVFADAIARPHFDPAQWSEVSVRWQQELRLRDRDFATVSRVVSQAVIYGPDTPYGHPARGRLATASLISREHLKSFHEQTFRPDRGLLVVVGDLSRSELDSALAKNWTTWTKPSSPAPKRIAPPQPAQGRPRLVLVDCQLGGQPGPDSHQTAVSVVLPAVVATHQTAPLLQLASRALGGRFNTRLSVDTRGARGWFASAHTVLSQRRGVGSITARALTRSRTAAAAVRKLLVQIDNLGLHGLTTPELDRVRAQQLTELLLTNASVADFSRRIATLNLLGLGPEADGIASRQQLAVTKGQLRKVAARHFKLTQASIVVVGPRTKLLAQLRALDLGEPELWSPAGRPIGGK